MKKLYLAIFALACCLAHADTTVSTPVPGSWTLMRGTANVAKGNGTAAACWAKAGPDAEARKASGNYTCNYSESARVTYTVPVPPKPADIVTTIQCVAPLVGSWVQTTTTTLVNNVWVPSVSPTSAPAGACTAVVVVTPPVVVAGNLPAVDKSKVPPAETDPKKVFSGPRVQPAPGPFGMGDPQGPNPNDVGAFRLICYFSHMSFDDPIVYPGQSGASHLHTFVGNTGTDANSTTASIAGSGNSTCSGGTLNRSAYWFPSMIDTTDGTPIAPISMLVYYKTGYGGVDIKTVQAVPTGLRFISGSAAGTPTSGTSASRFACLGGTQSVGWQASIPASCLDNTELMMEVSFPQCWDGKNLDSPDHKSHMAETTGSGCPATHPVAIPKIDYEIHFAAPAVAGRMAKWRLSSDNYATTSPGGFSGHGDYLMGWDVDTMNKIKVNCLITSTDCHTNLLGDGTWLY